MDEMQCIEHILEAKLTGSIVMKHYLKVGFSHIKNKRKF